MPRGNRRLPDACVERLRAADAILHAGDLMEREVLEVLQASASRCTWCAGTWTAHGSGAASAHAHARAGGRARRDGPRRRAGRRGGWSGCGDAFPTAQAVVFGHSHIPLHEAEGRLPDLQSRLADRAPAAAAAHDGDGDDRGWKDLFRLARRVVARYLSKHAFRSASGAERPQGDAGARASGPPGAAGGADRRAADRDRGGRASGGEPRERFLPPAPTRQVRLRGGGRGRHRPPAAMEAAQPRHALDRRAGRP